MKFRELRSCVAAGMSVSIIVSTIRTPISPLFGAARSVRVRTFVVLATGELAPRSVSVGGPVVLAFCWSHCRRKFYEVAEAGHAPIAEEALRRIAALYAIEADIRGFDAGTRVAERQVRSKPITDALRPWLEGALARLPGKSKLAEAIRYTLRLWPGLLRHLEDGRVEIDSNTVERSIRPIALTRKNALFAGSDKGAEHWAVIASLVETCKLNGLNPHAYLTSVLERIVAGHPQSRIDELMPWG